MPPPILAPEILINSIPCTIRVPEGRTDGVIVEAVGYNQPPTAKLTFKCPWVDRYAVLLGLGGGVTGTAQRPVRIPPFLYPDSPNLRVISIDRMASHGKMALRTSDGWPTFDYALIDVTFGVFPWGFDQQDPGTQNDPTGQPWITTRFKSSSEIIVPTGGTFKWSEGPFAGKPVQDGKLAFIRGKFEIAITRHWMPAVPVQYMMFFENTINDSDVTIGDFTYPRGFLMLGPTNSVESADTLGNRTYEVEHTILGQRDYDWNSFFAPDWNFYHVDTAGDGSGRKPAEFADWFTPLVQGEDA